jgi:hypothetical protein
MSGNQTRAVARLTRVLVAARTAGAVAKASRGICVAAAARAGVLHAASNLSRGHFCHAADKVLARSARRASDFDAVPFRTRGIPSIRTRLAPNTVGINASQTLGGHASPCQTFTARAARASCAVLFLARNARPWSRWATIF